MDGDGPGGVAIRAGRAADAGAIGALVHAAFAKWAPLIGRLPTPMQADYALALGRHRFDLLHADGVLAALVETALVDGADGGAGGARHLSVVTLAVHPDHQGRGLGSRLLALAEGRAAAAGIAEARLYTNKLYVENLRLYAARGYRVTGEAPYAGPDRTRAEDVVVHMAKDLRTMDLGIKDLDADPGTGPARG